MNDTLHNAILAVLVKRLGGVARISQFDLHDIFGCSITVHMHPAGDMEFVLDANEVRTDVTDVSTEPFPAITRRPFR